MTPIPPSPIRSRMRNGPMASGSWCAGRIGVTGDASIVASAFDTSRASDMSRPTSPERPCRQDTRNVRLFPAFRAALHFALLVVGGRGVEVHRHHLHLSGVGDL